MSDDAAVVASSLANVRVLFCLSQPICAFRTLIIERCRFVLFVDSESSVEFVNERNCDDNVDCDSAKEREQRVEQRRAGASVVGVEERRCAARRARRADEFDRCFNFVVRSLVCMSMCLLTAVVL